MNLFKGAFYLVDESPLQSPLKHGFEPEFGNAAATRQWLADAFHESLDPHATEAPPAALPCSRSAHEAKHVGRAPARH